MEPRSVVVNHLQRALNGTNAVTMCMFCNHKERTEQTYENLIGSLLKQLVLECPIVSASVENLYRGHLEKNTRPTSREFLDTLNSEIEAFFSSAFIVVDALDEGPDHEGTRASLVSDLRNLSSKVRLLVTSRNLPSIKDAMAGVPRLQVHTHDDDIPRYVEGRLSKEPQLRRLLEDDLQLRAIIAPTVKDKSDGMRVVFSSCSRVR